MYNLGPCYVIYIYIIIYLYIICSDELLTIFLLFSRSNSAIYLVQLLVTSDFYIASSWERVIRSPHKKMSKIDILFIKSCRLEVETTTWSICTFVVKIIDEFMMLGQWKKRLVIQIVNCCPLKLVSATQHDVELKRKWVEIGIYFR
jgi:hypothetical protein